MKTIGLLGGMSWESTNLYYRFINEGVRKRLGGLHSAKIVMLSVNFHEIEQLQEQGDWQRAGDLLAEDSRRIEAAGADFLLICTNTMHKVADSIQAVISIPLLHIADVTAEKIASDGITTIGLLGTRFTMQEEFYRGRMVSRHGLNVLTPEDADMDIVHNVIFDELCRGAVNETSRQEFVRIIEALQQRGAKALVLGCTEICMLISQQDTAIPLYDTTQIHAEAAVNMALA